MSQSDFLVHVVKWQVLMDQIIMPNAIKIMEVVVNNPDRLHQSAFSAQKTSEKTAKTKKGGDGGNKGGEDKMDRVASWPAFFFLSPDRNFHKLLS